MERTKAQRIMARLLRQEGLNVIENVLLPGGEADILLPHYKVVIELDGYFHLSSIAQSKDKRKESSWIENGYQVYRFSNNEVYNQRALCLSKIIDHIKNMEGVLSENLSTPLKDNHILKEMHRNLLNQEKLIKNSKENINPKLNPEAYFLSLDSEKKEENHKKGK